MNRLKHRKQRTAPLTLRSVHAQRYSLAGVAIGWNETCGCARGGYSYPCLILLPRR